jgi:hypothetical protein
VQSLVTDPRSRVRFPTLPDFLTSSASGTASTHPREYNWGATWKQSLEIRVYGRGDGRALYRRHPLSAKVGTNFVDNRRSLGRYSSFGYQEPSVNTNTITGHCQDTRHTGPWWWRRRLSPKHHVHTYKDNRSRIFNCIHFLAGLKANFPYNTNVTVKLRT